MRPLFVSAAFMLTVMLFGQVQVFVLDENQEALVGTRVEATSLSNGNSQVSVTNANGEATFALDLPIELNAQFIGYKNLTVTVSNNGTFLTMIPDLRHLEEVVVTGQYASQSLRNSVYKVNSIGSDRMIAQNARTPLDILANELNVQFSRDNATGRSGIRMQGMDAQYVKILLDGVPLAGRGGASNDVDLSQIDIQTIERVEIVEGPMAVSYGADALAGVVNFITKKDAARSNIKLSLQSESIGEEYSWFHDGIHSPSVQSDIRINDRVFTQVSARRYHFGGFQGTSEGRQHDWMPKSQNFGGVSTRYSLGAFEIFYRLDFMDELIEYHGLPTFPSNQEAFAADKDYTTRRWMHQLQAERSFNGGTINSVFSYSDYDRVTEDFISYLQSGEEGGREASNTTFFDSFFTRQTLSNIKWGLARFQLGLDGTHEKIKGSTLSPGEKTLTEWGFFGSSELQFGKLKVRPGVRFTQNSGFSSEPSPSVNFLLDLTSQLQIRWSYGRGYRTPSVRELYYEFIDSNHNILGNPELNPERSHSFNADISRSWGGKFELSAGGFYNDQDNLITYITYADQPGQPTSYINQLKFKTSGFNLKTKYREGNLKLEVGGSYIGRYQRLSEDNEIPSMLYFPEAVVRSSYYFDRANLDINLFYKINGRQEQYFLNDEDEVFLTERGAFHMVDLTARKSFSNGLSLGAGVRNLLDITNVNNNSPGGAHDTGNGQSPIAFGRSYFLNINYQLNL